MINGINDVLRDQNIHFFVEYFPFEIIAGMSVVRKNTKKSFLRSNSLRSTERKLFYP